MNKCGHVIYLEGIPIMKTGDAHLCQVEQMSKELERKKERKKRPKDAKLNLNKSKVQKCKLMAVN